LPRLPLGSNRFGFEVEITWRDGLAALWHIVRFNLLRRRRV
jgi:hypothetical protein